MEIQHRQNSDETSSLIQINPPEESHLDAEENSLKHKPHNIHKMIQHVIKEPILS